MLRNYFALYHAAMELDVELGGALLTAIHSQQKNELTFSFETASGDQRQLVVTVRSQEFSLSTRSETSRKKRNTASLMASAAGRRVTGVSMAPRDREILIGLDDGHTVVIRFFSADTNILLARDGMVVDAFKDAAELAGEPVQGDPSRTPVLRSLEKLAASEAGFMEAFAAAGCEAVPLEKRISDALPGFDRKLAKMLIERTGGDDSPKAVHDAFSGIFYELVSPTPHVVDEPGRAPAFSILEPRNPEQATCFDSVIDAMNHYTRRMHRHLSMHGTASGLRSEYERRAGWIEQELGRAGEQDREEAAEGYERFGHLLTAAIGNAEPTGGTIDLPDIFTEGAPLVTIRLKPGQNLQQNAAWYFSKAAKSRLKRQGEEERRTKLRAELASLREKLRALDDAKSIVEIEKITGRKGGNNAAKGGKQRQEAPKARFRTVQLTASVTLLVGRNASDNELLTFGHARPDDIWLHARGASGSHCVLKGATMQSLAEIRRAAEIAAWYSGAKHSGMVPVIYTPRKYVRRDRKAVGSVIVDREKVIMVHPRQD